MLRNLIKETISILEMLSFVHLFPHKHRASSSSLCCVFIRIAETWPSFDRLFCDLEGQQATTAPSAVTGAPVGPADLGRYHGFFFFFCLLNLEDIVWLYWIRCATKNDDTKALDIVYTIRYIRYCTHTTYLEEELEITELMPFWLLTKVKNKLN